MQKTGTCLSETEINDYLAGTIETEKRCAMESHLCDCDACLEKIVFAYQTVKEFAGSRQEGVRVMRSSWKKNLWLFGALVMFALSFLVRHYFVQFLVATIILAAKWMFDSVNARILIMIYEAWKKGGEEETSKILRRLDR